MAHLLLGLMGTGPKTVNLSTNILYGVAGSPGTATSTYVTVGQANMVPPLNYVWSRVSGSTNIFPSNQYGKSIYFFGYLSYGDISGVWKCTVTDSTGFSADTPNLSIYFSDLSI